MRALALVLLMGCGFHYSSSTTRGTACADASGVFCDKLEACGFDAAGQRTACADALQAACCGDAKTCGEFVANPDGAATCLNRTPGENCVAFDPKGGVLPAYCRQMF